jgi:hypothetical protein
MSKAAAGASSIRALVLSIQRRRRGTDAIALKVKQEFAAKAKAKKEAKPETSGTDKNRKAA